MNQDQEILRQDYLDEDMMDDRVENDDLMDHNSSFLSSLNDEELIDFINKLSQDGKKRHNDDGVEIQNDGYQKTPLRMSQNRNDHDDILDGLDSDLLKSSSQVTIRQDQQHVPADSEMETSKEVFDKDEELPFQLAQQTSSNQNINQLQEQNSSNLNNRTSSFDDSQDEDSNVVFGDYASYFMNKTKQQERLDNEYLEWEKERQRASGDPASSSSGNGAPPVPATSEILKNCRIHVNGHTTPNIHTLHKLIVLNGGKFVHHMSNKGQVTHIIAERLTPRKMIHFKNCKVVKPEWLLKSIELGKLCDWIEYSVLGAGYGQKRLGFKRSEEIEGNIEEEEEDNDIDDEDEDDDLNVEEELGDDVETDEPLFVPQEEAEEEPTNNEAQPDATVPIQNKSYSKTIDSRHPDFLQSFFEKSRLHHLSKWKSELRYEFYEKLSSLRASQGETTGTSNKYQNSKAFKLIIHIDFDCFFAHASALKHPDLDPKTQPIAITHSSGSYQNSSSEISSCNYPARAFGLKNGMMLKSALVKCPDLICLGYEFSEYERISRIFYDILGSIPTDSVYPVSIDEALLDVSSLFDENDENLEGSVTDFCWNLKQRVLEQTKCDVSLGCSRNVMMAKLALRRTKPDGVLVKLDDDEENVKSWIDGFDVVELPGIGRSIEYKLMNHLLSKGYPVPPSKTDNGASTRLKVGTLRSLNKPELQKLLGSKNGIKLHDFMNGIDPTSIIVIDPSEFKQKSISIDISWGIRFDKIEEIDEFLFKVAEILCLKLKKFKSLANQVVLKIMKRKPGVTTKFLGHGPCDSFSRSSNMSYPTSDHRHIGNELKSMYRFIGCEPLELRGVGVILTKLSNEDGKAAAAAPSGGIQQLLKGRAALKTLRERIGAVSDSKKRTFEVPGLNNEHLNLPVVDNTHDNPVSNKDEDARAENDNKDGNNSVIEVLNSSIVDTSFTQLEIPSDLDSSILRELPPSIQDTIQRQRDKNSVRLDELPSKIDMKVFKELPIDIQEELKHELKRRQNGPMMQTVIDEGVNQEIVGHSGNSEEPEEKRYYIQQVWSKDSTSPKKFVKVFNKKRTSPGKRKSPSKRTSPYKTATDGNNMRGVSESPLKRREDSVSVTTLIQSPSKRLKVTDALRKDNNNNNNLFNSTTIKLNDLDRDVLNELPEELKKGIIAEYSAYEKISSGMRVGKSAGLRERLQREVVPRDYVLDHEKDFYTIRGEIMESVNEKKGETDNDGEINEFDDTILKFQKLTKLKDIVSLIDQWIRSTFDKGPNKKDLLLFEKYLMRLDPDVSIDSDLNVNDDAEGNEIVDVGEAHESYQASPELISSIPHYKEGNIDDGEFPVNGTDDSNLSMIEGTREEEPNVDDHQDHEIDHHSPIDDIINDLINESDNEDSKDKKNTLINHDETEVELSTFESNKASDSSVAAYKDIEAWKKKVQERKRGGESMIPLFSKRLYYKNYIIQQLRLMLSIHGGDICDEWRDALLKLVDL